MRGSFWGGMVKLGANFGAVSCAWLLLMFSVLSGFGFLWAFVCRAWNLSKFFLVSWPPEKTVLDICCVFW